MEKYAFKMKLNPGMEAPVLAMHLELGLPLDQTIPPCDVRLGTTRGTNAITVAVAVAVAVTITTTTTPPTWALPLSGMRGSIRLLDLGADRGLQLR